MNRNRKSIGTSSKAKAKKGSALTEGEVGTSKRGDNWKIDETRTLLDACEEVQLLTHKRDLNFKSTQWTHIYELFKEKDRKSRTKDQVVNRIKTMRREFGNFRELANKAVDRGFVVPQDRYYLVDLGYANNRNFMCPYRGRPYHLDEYRGRHRTYNCPEDLFNHRHAQLRNIVEKTFGLLKIRFKICQWMRRYKFKIQARIVVACCILHNFINRQNMIRDVSDESWLNAQQVGANISTGDTGIEGDFSAHDNEVRADLRERIKNILWDNM